MSVRVIAGTLKNRVLRVPVGLATRPTGAKVREAVFSILGDLEALRVLDVYAGSGALGIEALSRGAGSAVFVDSDRAAVACIRANLATLGIEDRARVLPLDVKAALRRLSPDSRFDLILADPPWAASSDAQNALARAAELLDSEGRLVFEHARSETPDIDGLALYDRRVWGDTAVAFFRRSAPGI